MNRINVLLTVIACLLFVIVGLLGLLLVKPNNPAQPATSNAQTFPKPSTSPSESSQKGGPTPQSPAFMPQPNSTAPPDINAVTDYIAFVRQVESEKQRLIQAENAQLATQLRASQSNNSVTNNGDTSEQNFHKLEQQVSVYTDKWVQLIDRFSQRVPPDPCRELEQTYLAHLNVVQSSLASIESTMQQVQDDPAAALSSLEAMKGRGASEMDKTTQEANAAIIAVCNRYGLPKEPQISY